MGQSILSQVNGRIGLEGAVAGQIAPSGLPDAISDIVPALAPSQDVVRDEESGTVILPQSGPFKGFSSGQ